MKFKLEALLPRTTNWSEHDGVTRVKDNRYLVAVNIGVDRKKPIFPDFKLPSLQFPYTKKEVELMPTKLAKWLTCQYENTPHGKNPQSHCAQTYKKNFKHLLQA